MSLELTYAYRYLPHLSTLEPQPILSHTHLLAAMARKEKKKIKSQLKSSYTSKEANAPKLWPYLPPQLIYLIEQQPPLSQNKTFSRAVTKSWRLPSKCNPNPAPPWLRLTIDDQEPADTQIYSFDVRFKEACLWCWREELHIRCKSQFLGCFHGVLLCQQLSISSYRNPSPCLAKRELEVDGKMGFALWDVKYPVLYAASYQSPYPKNKCTLIYLTGIARPAFAFYRTWKGTGQWIKKDSTIIDPHCSDPNERSHLLRFTSGIWFKQKFYALSLQGTLAVIEEIDSDLRITALGNKRAVPSITCKHFRECMIESEGEILLVFLVSRDTIKVVDYVEIYKLDVDNLRWIKKESFGNRTLILGINCYMSVLASKVRCRRNCVYFTPFSADGWWVYDMETAVISTPSKSQLWIDPTAED